MSISAELRAGLVTTSAEQMRAAAAAFASTLGNDVTLALHGPMGVGKTTFVQGLATGLGVSDHVTSPTFAIYTVHRGKRATLVHLDAYRLEHESQAEGLLLEEFLKSPWILAVEWPERVAGWLPANALHLDLAIDAQERHSVRLRE